MRNQFEVSKEDGAERIEKYYLRDDELKKLIAVQLERYETLEASDLQSLREPYDVLFAWREFTGTPDGPRGLLKKALETDEGFINTLSKLRIVSSSAHKGVPHLPEGYLKTLVDAATVKSRLEELASSEGPQRERASSLLGVWWPLT